MKIKDYKPHIDGLRALAVLPVIFFHAGFDYFKGGFIGVDIFFVISGYLITNIIIKDLSKKKFSLQNFYLRRARRILPALLFITLISILFATIFLPDKELKFVSKQAISVVLFVSNFFFWKNTGYFDPNSELQPLLHTWSLGVEEQFYILFPIFLILVWNFFRKKLIFFLLIIIFLSLFLSQAGGNFKLQNISNQYPFLILPFEFFWQAGSANFYLPFGRAWELLTGSLLSIYLSKNKIDDKKTNNIFSIFGIFLIIISIITFSDNLQYPSIFTIMPVFGTILLIVFSTKSTLSFKLFSYKPLVFFGLISFSLYLWHQPLFAFSRIYSGINLLLYQKILIILLTISLSIFTWKYIEKPFRDQKILNNKKTVIILLSKSLFIILLSLLIFFSKIKSFQEPIPNNILKTFQISNSENCFDLDYAHLDKKKWFCEIGDESKKISFVIIGDSHALALKDAFNESGKIKNKKGILTGFSGCPGLLGINSIRPDRNIKNCKLLNEKLLKFIKDSKIKQLFLVSRWSYYTVGNYARNNFNFVAREDKLFSNKEISKKSIVSGIEKTVEEYEKLNVEVIFVHQTPDQIYEPRFAYQRSLNQNTKKIDLKKLNSFGVDYKKHFNHQKYFRENLKNVKNSYSNVKEMHFDDIFCNNSKCFLGSEYSSDYADKNHLSINGSMRTVNKIKDYIK